MEGFSNTSPPQRGLSGWKSELSLPIKDPAHQNTKTNTWHLRYTVQLQYKLTPCSSSCSSAPLPCPRLSPHCPAGFCLGCGPALGSGWQEWRCPHPHEGCVGPGACPICQPPTSAGPSGPSPAVTSRAQIPCPGEDGPFQSHSRWVVVAFQSLYGICYRAHCWPPLLPAKL